MGLVGCSDSFSVSKLVGSLMVVCRRAPPRLDAIVSRRVDFGVVFATQHHVRYTVRLQVDDVAVRRCVESMRVNFGNILGALQHSIVDIMGGRVVDVRRWSPQPGYHRGPGVSHEATVITLRPNQPSRQPGHGNCRDSRQGKGRRPTCWFRCRYSGCFCV